MNQNHYLGDLADIRAEVDRRHGLASRRRERPESSLRVSVRAMGRRRWEASHLRRSH